MNFKFVYTFGKIYGFRTTKRFAAYIVYSLLIPISLLFIFGIISSGRLVPLAILGGLISVFVTNGINTLSDSAQLRIQHKFYDLFIATPLASVEYVMGFVLAELFFALPSIVLFMAIGYAYHIFTIYLAVLTVLIMLMLYFAIAFFSVGISFLPRHTRSIWSFTGILTLALTLFPPVYYPYTELPKPVLWLFLLLPSGSAAVFLQGVFGFSKVMHLSGYIFVAEFLAYMIVALLIVRLKMNHL